VCACVCVCARALGMCDNCLCCGVQVMYDDDVHALTCSRDKSFLCWDLRVRCAALLWLHRASL
jgi:hypothetical protein